MGKNRHLNLNERYQIQALLDAGVSPKAIALQLGRHVDTINRERARASPQDGRYVALHAQQLSEQRTRCSRNARRISADDWRQVDALLELALSPQQACERLYAQKQISVSHESVYLRRYASAQESPKIRCRRRKRAKRSTARYTHRKGAICNRVDIDKRPVVVADRVRMGDIEGDTVVGKQSIGALVTLVDRKSRYVFVRWVPRRTAVLVEQAIVDMLGPQCQRMHTLTLDNGSEFAHHQSFAKKLGMQVFFAKPHQPWQRGANENTNGLLRHYFPKGCSLQNISHERVQAAQDALNHRPRKCLNWRTPHEVFYDLPMIDLTL